MNYIYVEKNNQSASYLVTTSCNQPRINVGGTGYIPLVMGTIDAPMIKYQQFVTDCETMRAGSYTSTTVKSTSSCAASSYVGCAGTSSSSGSTLQTTIEASTAMSFTSTAAETRSSTSGYNGLSNAQAQTCSSTSSWAGSSTRQSDYWTTRQSDYETTRQSDYWTTRRSDYYAESNDVGALSNTSQIIGSTDVPATRVNTNETKWTRVEYIQVAEARCAFLQTKESCNYAGVYSYYRTSVDGYYTASARNGDGFTMWGTRNFSSTWENTLGDYDHWGEGVTGNYFNSYFTYTNYGANGRANYSFTINPLTWYNGTSVSTALIGYKGYLSRASDYVTSRASDYITSRASDYITSRVSYYETTLANSAGLSSVTALTRSSTSAYSGISHRRSDYYGSQVNSNNMTNATALTCSSTYGYSGITTRPEEYASSSVDVGNLSYTTALLEPAYRTNTVTTAYSGVSYEYSTYAHSFVYGYFQYNSDGQYNYTVNRVDAASYEIYDTHGDRIARNNSYQGGWMPAYVDFRRNVGGQLVDGIMDINIPDATNTARNIFYSYDVISATGTGGPSGGGNTYTFRKEFRERTNTVSYTSTNTIGMDSVTELTGTVLGDIDHYNTTGYSGISSSQSNYAVVRNSPTGLSNVTTLTQSSTSGYSGQLSRTSSYETLIPNDGANALAAQALTCSSTSKYRGISSTSASMSSTEMRTSYYTSVYSESTTRSYTVATEAVITGTRQTTITSQSVTSGNGYSTVEVLSSTNTQYTSSTWVAISETTLTTRTSTYTRTSEAIKSYGDSTSLSTYVSTNTYISTYSAYL